MIIKKPFYTGILCLLVACQSLPHSPKLNQSSLKESGGELVRIPTLESQAHKPEFLNAYLFRPKGPGPFPAIVALHGCSGIVGKNGKFHARDLDWATRLSKSYVVLYPDSFATRDIDEICTKKVGVTMPKTERSFDAVAALKWLSTQTYVDKEDVGIMGWSNGGSSLLWAIDENFKKPDDLKNDFKYAITFYPGCHSVNRDLNWKPRVHVDILMGELDNWVSPKTCSSLVEKFKKSKLMDITLYPNSYHDFDAPNIQPTHLHNLASTATNMETATIATNSVTREEAIKKVMDILNARLANRVK